MDTQTLMQKNPLDYIKMIFRRKWLIIIPTVIGLIGGIVAANILPKSYEASTLVLVEESRIINPLIKDLAVSTSVAQRLTTLREQILGWDRVNQLISKLNLATDVKSQEEFEKLVANLRNNIKVRIRGQNIIGISYRGRNAAESMNIVKTITDIFIAENLRQQNAETDNAIAFINDQLELYKKKLKHGEVAAMEDKLSNLLLDSTNKHPMVIQLRKDIEAAKNEIEQGNYEVDTGAIATSDAELKKLKEELGVLRQELATSGLDAERGGENRAKLASATNEKLYKLLLLERVEKVAKQDLSVNQRLYNELLDRLETAKITQRLEASKEGTRYTILDPARLPLKPASPNKILLLFLGTFLGMFSGTGFVFTSEMFDHSFLGVDEAKACLELPILGAVSKIITQKDVKAQRIRKVKITGASVLVGAILLIVIIFNVILGG